MSLEGLGTLTNVIESICDVIKKKEEIKKMMLKVVIGAGLIVTVAAGAYTIYKFVVKKNEADALEDGEEDAPEIEAKPEEQAEVCTCGCENKTEAAEETK